MHVWTVSKCLGALRWSGCEVGLCERVDDDRLAGNVTVMAPDLCGLVLKEALDPTMSV